jgi:uncharacterized membrane protein
MTATFAPSPWPAPTKSPSAAVRRFGHEVVLEGGARALRWVLQRNCSITPRQLVSVYLSLCALAATISAGFWWQGARLVSAFAGVELLLVGLALLVYARHAGDRDVLTLSGRRLAVEQRRGQRMQRADFHAEWTAVEPAAGQGSLVALSGRGQVVRVGRFLRPEFRNAFAQELRGALRRAAQLQHDSETN